jgi:hypothetical protein
MPSVKKRDIVLFQSMANVLNHAPEFLPQWIVKALEAHSGPTQPSKEDKSHHFAALA